MNLILIVIIILILVIIVLLISYKKNISIYNEILKYNDYFEKKYPNEKNKLFDNLIHKLDIINNFYNKKYIFSSCLLGKNIYQNNKSFVISNNYAITSDIHGDLNCLLFILINTGAYTFKETPFIIRNIIKKKNVNSIKQNKIMNYRILPNLIKTSSNINIILNGDCIDRGNESEEILYLLEYLLESDNNIIYLLGNHEYMYMDNLYNHEYSTSILLNNTSVYETNIMKETIKKMILSKKITLCYCLNDIIVSHAILLNKYVRKITKKKQIQDIVNELNLYLLTHIDNYDLILNLVEIRSFDGINQKILIDLFDEPLCKQILGHDINIKGNKFFIGSIFDNLYIDIMQSSGFTGISTPYYILNNKVYFMK